MGILRPVEWIDRDVLEYFRQKPPAEPVVVACSGGADSVFLVLTLHAVLSPEQLHIAHFNHGLRGKASDEDASFVESLAKGLGIGVTVGHPAQPLSADEAGLREARYAWLVGLAGSRGSRAIALGHHADDLIETQLLALLTGSGPSGFASPMPVREFTDGHLRTRPLLNMRRSTIERTLQSAGAPWREDASNRDPKFTRNRLRMEVLPLLASTAPQDLFSSAQRTRRLMQEAIEALDEQVRRLSLDFSDPRSLDVGPLLGAAAGLIRRALTAWWIRHYPENPLSGPALDALVALVNQRQSGQAVSIGLLSGESPARTLEMDASGLLRLGAEQSAVVTDWRGAAGHWAAGPLFLPDGSRLEGQVVHWESPVDPYREADPHREAWLSLKEPLLGVRSWRAGDRYLPLGAPGRRKLQDLFTDAKLNSEQKARLPVITSSDGNILWVPGFPPAESVKICPGANTALQLTYHPH